MIDSEREASGSFDYYVDDLRRHPPFEDREHEREVAHRAEQGDRDAARRLVEANLRFVVSYVKRYQGSGLSLEELVSVGNLGLLKAVRKFDPDRGVKFISYAVWWVKQAVLQALAEEGGSVRIPQTQQSRLRRVAKAEGRLTNGLGRPPTDQELADELGKSREQIRKLQWLDQPALHLDALIDETAPDDRTHYERFGDSSGIEEEVQERTRRDFLEQLFAEHLTDRERKILVLYYGLDGRGGTTLGEIGTLMGLTRERIRQLRNRAFHKLRRSEHGETLERLWGEQRTGRSGD